MTFRRLAVPALAFALGCPGAALAEPTARPIHEAVARLADAPPAATGLTQTPQQPDLPGAPAAQPRPRSLTRKIVGGVAGGVGGFFVGGYLGAKIEGDGCNCDDPGFKGFLIGLPIGAAVGAFLGAKFL